MISSFVLDTHQMPANNPLKVWFRILSQLDPDAQRASIPTRETAPFSLDLDLPQAANHFGGASFERRFKLPRYIVDSNRRPSTRSE
jgi:hypothetical protein